MSREYPLLIQHRAAGVMRYRVVQDFKTAGIMTMGHFWSLRGAERHIAKKTWHSVGVDVA